MPQLEHDRGRRPADVQKVLYGLIHRAHTTKSGRRSYSDLKIASSIIGLGDLPSRPTLTRYMESPSIAPVLERLIELSAVPVSPLETGFAADSTAFGTSIRDQQWAEAKWGTAESRAASTGTIWTKAHFMVGVYTNIVTAAYITDSPANSGDSPQLPKLLSITDRHFTIKDVYADGAYQDLDNFKLIADLGANQYIPFEERNVFHSPKSKNGKLWNSLLQYFREHEDDFYAHYHQRSNVEASNSSVKRLFDNITRSISPAARVNEVLARVVAYNITRCIHASYIDGVEPFFGG